MWIKWLELATYLFCLAGVIIHTKYLTRENHRTARVCLILVYRRVRETTFPVHRLGATWLVAGMNALYGRTWGRRVSTSLALSVVYSVVAINVGTWLSPWIFSAEPEKTRLERTIDPYLFGLPRAEKIRAFDEDAVEVTPTTGANGQPAVQIRFVYDDEKYEDIRARVESFEREYRKAVAEHPEREAIAMLTLLRGTNVSPGFQYASTISLVLFNALIDLITFLGTVTLLSRLACVENIDRFAAGFVAGILGTVSFFFLTLLPYGILAAGDTGIFSVLVFKIPFGVILILTGLFGLLSILDEGGSPFTAVGIALAGTAMGIGLIAPNWERLYLVELPDLFVSGGVNWIPYLLATSTAIPALACSITILAVLVLKSFGSAVLAALQTYLEVMVKLKKPVVIAIFALPAGLVQFFTRVYPLLS